MVYVHTCIAILKRQYIVWNGGSFGTNGFTAVDPAPIFRAFNNACPAPKNEAPANFSSTNRGLLLLGVNDASAPPLASSISIPQHSIPHAQLEL
jgi:hypothetical protein